MLSAGPCAGRQCWRERAEDGFTQVLGQQFDRLVATMNRPGAGKATGEALFGEPAELDRTYRPGATETER